MGFFPNKGWLIRYIIDNNRTWKVPKEKSHRSFLYLYFSHRWVTHLKYPCLSTVETSKLSVISRPSCLSPFNVCICIFENNRSNGKEMQTQRMGSVPILCMNVNITIDTMLKFDANAQANVDVDAKCDGPLPFAVSKRLNESFIFLLEDLPIPRFLCKEPYRISTVWGNYNNDIHFAQFSKNLSNLWHTIYQLLNNLNNEGLPHPSEQSVLMTLHRAELIPTFHMQNAAILAWFFSFCVCHYDNQYKWCLRDTETSLCSTHVFICSFDMMIDLI